MLAIVVTAACGLTCGPARAGAINAHIPSDRRATMLSTMSMLRTLGIAVVNPVVVGWLADRSVPTAGTVLGAVAVCLAILSPLRAANMETYFTHE